MLNEKVIGADQAPARISRQADKVRWNRIHKAVRKQRFTGRLVMDFEDGRLVGALPYKNKEKKEERDG